MKVWVPQVTKAPLTSYYMCRANGEGKWIRTTLSKVLECPTETTEPEATILKVNREVWRMMKAVGRNNNMKPTTWFD